MSRKSKTSKRSIVKRNDIMQCFIFQNASQSINEGQDEGNNKVRILTCFYVTLCFSNILDKLRCI